MTESASSWGAEATLLELLRGMPRSWHATVLVSSTSPLLSIDPPDRVSIAPYDFAPHPALRSGSFRSSTPSQRLAEGLSVIRGAWRARRVARGYDAVLGFSLWQCPEFLLGAKLARTPFLLDLHDDFSGGIVNRIVRAMASASALVLAPSRHVLSRYGLTPDTRIAVVPRPVPAAKAPSARRVLTEHGPLQVGMFGQISPHKGVLDLIAAAESIPRGLVDLKIVGGTATADKTAYEAECAARIETLGPGSSLVPRVPDIEPYARTCDVIVNLSHQEAFGRSIVEALAHGALPVVLEGSGPSEIVRDTGRGIILSSVAELPAVLERLIKSSRADDAPWNPDDALSQYEPARVSADYWRLVTVAMAR